MPMFDLFANIWAGLRTLPWCRRGSTGVEMALILPVFLLTFSGLLELGRAFEQAHAVEKGLRSGVLYLARCDDPEAASSQAVARNLVKTGQIDGAGSFLAPGWSADGASVAITVSAFVVDGAPTPVIQIDAEVPFSSIVPGLADVIGVSGYTIRMSHQQAYVGS